MAKINWYTAGTDSKEEIPVIPVIPVNGKKIDKNLFVWGGTFIFGLLGVDRFMRGQIVRGVLKMFLCLGWFVNVLVLFIPSLTELAELFAPFLVKDDGLDELIRLLFWGIFWISWVLSDWITALKKAYGKAFGNSNFVIFDNVGKYIK